MTDLSAEAHLIVCPGCSGCLDDVTDDEVELEHQLADMMAERPDGNAGPPATCLHEWNPRLRGKTYTAPRTKPETINVGRALSRARGG